MKAKLFAILGVCLLVGIGFAVISSAIPANVVIVPKVNGYDTLVSAGEQMSLVPPYFHETTDIAELTLFLNENQASLTLLDEALTQDYIIPPASLSAAIESPEKLGHVRNLARVLVVQSRVAELEGRMEDAADPLAKAILLGDRFDRGGLLVHALTAIAIESIGTGELLELSPKLTAEKKSELLTMLEASLAPPRSIENELDEVMTRERAQSQQRLGRFRSFIVGLQGADQTLPAMQATRAAMERNRLQRVELFEALRSTE